ncbi:ABC transporter permease [Bacillus sp. 1P06AnD]|uniref:ABC transporter permease n=1 Tax=Bacillus sp. 1P06AnD TaxID=3132208 RepID=UPI0039A17F08
MKTKGVSLHLIKYELRNTCGNLFTIFFGIGFPILMSLLIAKMISGEMPAAQLAEATTSIFLTMIMIIPMATLLIGYAANYSQELENDIPLRMKLFGYEERSILLAKMIANLLFMICAVLIYVCVDWILLDMLAPTPIAAIVLCFIILLVSAFLFMVAHAVASIFKKFGPTYGVTMTLYFAFMILCGMMGITTDQLPHFLQVISKGLPMSYMNNDFLAFWQGRSYDFMPIVLSFIAFGSISFALLFISSWKNKRTVK